MVLNAYPIGFLLRALYETRVAESGSCMAQKCFTKMPRACNESRKGN